MKPWTPSTSSNRFNWGYCLTSRVREAFGCKTNGYEVNQFLTPINPLRRRQTSRGAPRIHWIANQIELRTELKRSGGFEFTQQGVVACAQLGVDLLQGGGDGLAFVGLGRGRGSGGMWRHIGQVNFMGCVLVSW